MKYYADHSAKWLAFIIVGLICFFVLLPIAILDLLFSRKAEDYLLNSYTKQQASKGALFAFFSGVLFNIFGIVSGIIMFNMNDSDYQVEMEPVSDKSFRIDLFKDELTDQ